MKENIINMAEEMQATIFAGTSLNNLFPDSESSTVFQSEDSCVASTLLEKAINGDFNNLEELKVKKLMAASLAIAKQKGFVPASIATQSLSALADEGISQLKAEYQVGEGIINSYEAADKLIDQATARAEAYLQRAVPKFVDKGIDALAGLAIRVYPPAATVVMNVKEPVKRVLTKVAKSAVSNGIRQLNKVAKKTVSTIGEKVKKLAKKFIARFA